MKQKIRELRAEEVGLNISKQEIEALIASKPCNKIIGQPRALKALKLGTEIEARGYNIFVTGLYGTGRNTAIYRVLKGLKADKGRLKDIVFVYNFLRPENPRVLYFPAGGGKKFKEDLHELIENLKSLIKSNLDSEKFKNEKERIVRETENEENRTLSAFESKLTTEGFQIVQVQEREAPVSDIVPLYQGRAVDFEELKALALSGEIEESFWKTMREKYYLYIDEMKETFNKLRAFRNFQEEKIRILQKETILPTIKAEIENIESSYEDLKVKQHLLELEYDIITHLYLFSREAPAGNAAGNPALVRYGVNILVDNGLTRNVPVIAENYPSSKNLLGDIDSQVDRSGRTRSSFMQIKAGSLIQASGGFLILRAEDLLKEENAWQNLKNALDAGRVEIQKADNTLTGSAIRMKPEPIDLDLKVIIIGAQHLYDRLYSMDEMFAKLFKIHAEFDLVMDRNPRNSLDYIGFIQNLIRNEDLKPIQPEGIAAIVEYSARLAEHQDRLSTQFSHISDLIRESDYWAGKRQLNLIDKASVSQAVEAKQYLSNLPEEKIQAKIASGELFIPLRGREIGKALGLVVYERGYYSFGCPCLITARISPGRLGLINIEREAGLSGKAHTKGVLIIEGFLRSRYARSFPLSISGSICFEQSYSELQGDSAALSEIYALLSAIAQVALCQDIAVTGSLNQHGEVQSIGKITAKVEGFFNTCEKMGLKGSQGVIIPERNIPNLMLSEAVKRAIRNSSFHIYPIKTVDEGLGILSTVEAGLPASGGAFPENSFNWLVEQRLSQFARHVKEFRGG